MRALIVLFTLFLLLIPAQADLDLRLPDDSRQMVVVKSPNWDSKVAVMQRFERSEAKGEWTPVGESAAVNLGRTGLAWGVSELMGAIPKGTLDGGRKVEGDGRAPAGLFPIGNAFGHPAPPQGYSSENPPFLVLTDEQCVDDGDSPYYNKVVHPDEVGGVTWSSAETMKISLYRLGVEIAHNCPRAQKGLGSCIFFHLQRGVGRPTAGCTSMAESDLIDLMLWLKTDERPVLLQLPDEAFKQLGDEFPN